MSSDKIRLGKGFAGAEQEREGGVCKIRGDRMSGRREMDKFQRNGRQEKKRTSICIAKAKIYRKYKCVCRRGGDSGYAD